MKKKMWAAAEFAADMAALLCALATMCAVSAAAEGTMPLPGAAAALAALTVTANAALGAAGKAKKAAGRAEKGGAE